MPLQPARLRPWMMSLLRLVLFPALIALAVLPADAAEETDSVVAVVNADPITRKTLAEETLRRYGADVLDNMINRHLILQACKSAGIEVTSAEVRGEINRLAAKFGLSMESYLQLLREERQIAPDQYSREIIWPMLALRKLVADKVEVTEEEFNRAYMAQYGEALKCRMIMVASRATADSLRQQAIAKPDSFEQLAKKYSEDESSASVGGLIPPIRRFTGDAELEKAAFALADNEISAVLPLGDQWIILQAVRRIEAATPSPQAMPVIREQISDRIRDQKMRGAATQLFARLQQDANVIKVLGDDQAAKQYPGVAAIINGQQVSIAAVATESVERHGSEVLTGEINRKMLTQALRKANKQVTDKDVSAEIARAATSFGYVQGDGTPDVEGWMKSILSKGSTTRDVYIRDAVWPSVALKKLVEDEVKITQRDMQEGFESAYGPRVEVLAIVLADQRSAQKIWEMARDNPTEHFFGQLAQQYSVEPVSASNNGKVPPIRKHGGQPAIEREAFQLKPGELSGIVATGDQFVILRCQGFTEPVVTDFNAVREELVRDLTDQKMNAAMGQKFDQLKQSSEIDNYLAAAKELPRMAAEDVPAKR